MAWRRYICGFDIAGDYGGYNGAVPNNGNVTISTSVKRSGAGSLYVNTPSGTASYLQLTGSTGGGFNSAFFRGYFYFVSFPSATRAIVSNGLASDLNGYPQLLITSSGHLAQGNNGSALDTGPTALSLNTWYCVEWGISAEQKVGSVRLNGGTEIDWTVFATSGGPSSLADFYLGATNTGTGAFSYYVDDVEYDWASWCGEGYVITQVPTAIVTDNANWTASSGTKLAAIADSTTTDYLVSNTTTGSGAHLIYSFDPMPPEVTLVRGAQITHLTQRDGASNGSFKASRIVGPLLETDLFPIGTTASKIWLSQTPNDVAYSGTAAGADLSVSTFTEQNYGLWNNSANPSRIYGIVRHVGVTADVAARPDSLRAFIASCDTGDLSEFAATSGTVTASTEQVRTGTYSSKVVATSGSTADFSFLLGAPPYSLESQSIYGRAYFYFSTLPSSGVIKAVEISNSRVTVHFLMGVDPSGRVALFDHDSSGSTTTPFTWSSAGTIQTGIWQRIEWFYRAPLGGTNGTARIWVDDVLVAEEVGNYSSWEGLASKSVYLGVPRATSVGNTVTVFVDDVVLDYGARVRSSKVLAYTPTGTGTFTGSNWTTPTGGTFASATAETPVDDDTSYIVTSTATTDVLSLNMGDLPSEATKVHALNLITRVKRDGASGGSLLYGPYVGGTFPTSGSSASGASVNSGASYTTGQKLLTTTPVGYWTTGLYNGMQVYLRSGTATNKTRLTNVRAVVEYVETSVGYKELVGDGYVKVPARTKQVRGDGYVIDTTNKNKQITADAVVRNDTPPVAMPSRMYLTSTAPSYYSNLQNGDWDVINVTVRKISGTSGGTIATRTVYKNATTEQGVLIYQGISDPIQAQVCQGSLRFMIATKEQRDAMDNVLMAHVWISQGNSDAIRGVLLDNYTWDLTDAEWSTNTDGLAQAVEVAANVVPVTAETGDRLIVELGYYSAGTFKGYGQLTYGGDYATYGELLDGENRTQGVAYLEWGGAIPIDSEPTTQANLREIDTDGVVQEQGVSTEITADGYIEAPASTQVDLDVTADGLVIVITEHTLDVTAEALVLATQISQITGSAVLQDTIWTDVSVDGLVQDSQAPEVTSDAVVQLQDVTKEITGSGIVVIQGQALELTATGLIFVSDQTTDLTTDGYIDSGAATRTLDLTADAFVTVTQTKEITGSALLSATDFGTKLYLTNLSPAWSGAVTDRKGTWNINGLVKLYMSEDPSGTTASQNRAVSETMTVNPTNVAVLMAVSPAISSPIAIGGMLDFVIGARESSSNANMVFKIHAWVSAGNTNTVRGTLINNWVDDSTNELDVTQGRGPKYQIPISPVTAQAGDYIIVEVGVAAMNTVTTNYTATMYYGANTPTAPDLAIGSFNYTSEFGYIAFTDNLPFVYQPSKVVEVATDGLVIGFTTKEITATALVKATQTAETTGTGVVFATQSCDVTTDAHLQHTTYMEIAGDGLIQDGGQLELSSDAIVFATQTLDVLSDGILFATSSLETETDALVLVINALEIESSALLQDTISEEVTADALVLDTQNLDLATDALVLESISSLLFADGVIQDTIETEITADARLIFVSTLDLTSDALLSATITADMGADALIVGEPGVLIGQLHQSRVLVATPVVLAPLTNTTSCIPPFQGIKRVLEE